MAIAVLSVGDGDVSCRPSMLELDIDLVETPHALIGRVLRGECFGSSPTRNKQSGSLGSGVSLGRLTPRE